MPANLLAAPATMEVPVKYYLTTPLYYVNAAPHIGHTYTTMAAETIAQFKRMQGFDAVMFTGTDEHGQKVERSAEAAGKTPQAFTDAVSAEFRKQWETARYPRGPHHPHHRSAASQGGPVAVPALPGRGYIYKGSYTGAVLRLATNSTSTRPSPGDPCPLAAAHRNRHRGELLLQALARSPINCWRSTRRSPTSSGPIRAATK